MPEAMIEHIYDESDHMYPLEGEGDANFEKRMHKLDITRQARMTDDDRRKVADLLKGLDAAEKKLGWA